MGASVTLACPCDEEPEPCGGEGYPCTFAEAPIEVIERSLELSEEVVTRLEDGATYEEVGAFLTGEEGMADVTVDGPVIGFRLENGRPMIVDFENDQEVLPDLTGGAGIATVATGSGASAASPAPARSRPARRGGPR